MRFSSGWERVRNIDYKTIAKEDPLFLSEETDETIECLVNREKTYNLRFKRRERRRSVTEALGLRENIVTH